MYTIKAIFIAALLTTIQSWAFVNKKPIIKETDGSIRVMIIDSGIDVKNPIIRHFLAENENINNEDYEDQYGHGTAIAGTILLGPLIYENNKVKIQGNNLVCPQVKLYSCSYWDVGPSHKNEGISKILSCYKEALTKKINLINYSGGGIIFSRSEYRYILKLQESGTILVTAAGNNDENYRVHKFYPASLNLKKDVHNVIPVGSLNKNFKKSYFSNYGINMVWEIGEKILSIIPPNSSLATMFSIYYYHYDYRKLSGTSQATAIYTHKLLMNKCKEINKGDRYGV